MRNGIKGGARLFNLARLSTTAGSSGMMYRKPQFMRQNSQQYNELTKGNSIKAAIFDFSGTTTDSGVFAPAVVFVDVFEKFRVPITIQEARVPMGLRKDLHIQAITEMPAVHQRWVNVYNREPSDDDIAEMFEAFIPMQIDCLPTHAQAIPGVADTFETLRGAGIKIGASTGFTQPMCDVLINNLTPQGVTFDAVVAGDAVINGARPTPHMVFENLDQLGIHNLAEVVKVDDTKTGVGEGLAAGVWSVCVTEHSNNVGALFDTFEQYLEAKKDKETFANMICQTEEQLGNDSGAHYVIPNINFLPQVINDINERLANGETPMNVRDQFPTVGNTNDTQEEHGKQQPSPSVLKYFLFNK